MYSNNNLGKGCINLMNLYRKNGKRYTSLDHSLKKSGLIIWMRALMNKNGTMYLKVPKINQLQEDQKLDINFLKRRMKICITY